MVGVESESRNILWVKSLRIKNIFFSPKVCTTITIPAHHGVIGTRLTFLCETRAAIQTDKIYAAMDFRTLGSRQQTGIPVKEGTNEVNTAIASGHCFERVPRHSIGRRN